MAEYQQKISVCAMVFLTIVPGLGVCNCPVYGCTLFHSFTTPTQFFNTSYRPQLLWKFEHDQLRPTGAGCVTNGGRVLCPMEYYQQQRSVLISWEALTNGRVSWNVSLDRPTLPLPVVDISGDVLVSNGYKLLGFTAEGKSYGKPILLYPIHGHLMDLSISSEQFLILLYKCGFFAVYITNGIPHASIWLNDTIEGVKGTFVPLNNQAINSSSSERLYLLSAFRPTKPSQNHSFSQDLHMRVYAIDVTASMAYRIQTIWTYNFILPSAAVPYMESNETICKVQYPPGLYPTDCTHKAKNKSESATKLPADVLVRGNVTLITFNYNDTESGESRCRVISITNLGKSYSINFSKDIHQQCSGMAYNSHETTAVPDQVVGKPLMIWLHTFDYSTQGSSLLLMNMNTGDIVMDVNVSSLVGNNRYVKITSQMLIACLYLGNSTIKSPSFEFAGKTPVPLIFAVSDSSGESSVIAIDFSDYDNLKVIWKVPLAGQYVSGQISTVDRLRDSLMIFTDQSGVHFYRIS